MCVMSIVELQENKVRGSLEESPQCSRAVSGQAEEAAQVLGTLPAAFQALKCRCNATLRHSQDPVVAALPLPIFDLRNHGDGELG